MTKKITIAPLPFTEDEIIKAVNSTSSITRAAKALTKLGETKDIPVGVVKMQQVREWLTRLESGRVAAEGFDRSKELVRSRNVAVENNKLRADVRSLTDALGNRDHFLDSVEGLVETLGKRAPKSFKASIGKPRGTTMEVELLLSDLQIGKLSPDYNTAVAKARLVEFGRAALFQIYQKLDAGYRITKITLGLLGDIIESDKKHANSARATDTGTAEQMFDAMEGIFLSVIEPLAQLGIPVDVICITGNHDWDDHGLNMFEPGKQQLSWPLYKSLEMVSDRSGYSNLNYIIPEGSYAVTEICGQVALFEHGVGVSVTEASMKAHKVKRAEQEKKHITYFRMGDKHTVTTFNSGQMVVNGAFFGARPGGTEYSGIAGYSSVPAQWMGFHVHRDDNRLSLYDSFVIQLDHIGE